jgi:DNA-binding transcriptional LysR family regulator
MAQMDLNDVAMFVRVVDAGAFATAARARRVPTSTVSRAVARLERALGTRLLQRTTRAVVPTAEGHAFYAQVGPALAAVEGAADAVEGTDRIAKGQLRVTALADFGHSFVAGVVAAFTRRHPQIDVELLLTSRKVKFIQERIDVGIRGGQVHEEGLVARKLGELRAGFYAAPSYLEAHGTPKAIPDLARHELVLLNTSAPTTLLDVQGPAGPERAAVRARIGCDDFTFLRQTLVAGAGIGPVPNVMAAAEVEAGRLVRVLAGAHIAMGPVHIVYPAARNVPARVRLFRDFVIAAYGQPGAARWD